MSEDDAEAQPGAAMATRLPMTPSAQCAAWTSAVLGVDVGGLDLDLPAHFAQALGEPVRRTPLGVGSGEPALEGAELLHDLHARGDIHRRAIIACRRCPGELALLPDVFVH